MGTRRILALIVVIVSQVGCVSGAYDRLPSERDDFWLSTLIEKTASYKNGTLSISTVTRDSRQRIALHEYGSPESGRALVFIHGCINDASGWRLVVGQLASEYLVLTVDLLGYGESDKPHPDDAGTDGYSPSALAERIAQVLEIYSQEYELPAQVTLVGHSLGGAIILRMLGCEATGHRYPVLERVDRVVLLSPLDVELPNLPAVLREVVEISTVKIQIADMAGVLRNRIAEGVAASVCNPSRGLREEADRIHEILTNRRLLISTRAILTQAVPLDGDQLDWERARRLVADYRNIDVPCLILWGEQDHTLPISMGHKLACEIPTAELHPVPDCKHSMQLEFPALCAESVREFSESESTSDIDFSLENVSTTINEQRDQHLRGGRS